MNGTVNTKDHLHKILSHFDTAMLITHSENVGIHPRPMHIAELTSHR
jgi:hypothetical protein